MAVVTGESVPERAEAPDPARPGRSRPRRSQRIAWRSAFLFALLPGIATSWAAAPSTARVEFSEPTIEGGLAKDPDAKKTLASTYPSLQACYEKALQAGRKGSGVIELHMKVGAGGTVLRVETPRTGTVSGAATSCMLAKLGLLQFNPGKPSTISFNATCTDGAT